MRKLFALICALLLPAAVHAGDWVGVDPSTHYTCLPKPFGSGTAYTYKSNEAGAVIWWYCPGPDGRWQLSRAVATKEALSSGWDVFKAAKAIVAAPDPVAALNAAMLDNWTLPLADERLERVWLRYAARMQADRPPLWAVSPDGTSETAPVWQLAGGKFYERSDRATVGSACDCAAPAVINGVTWCTYAGAREGSVTACSRTLRAP